MILRPINEQKSDEFPLNHFIQFQDSAQHPDLRTQNSNPTHQRPNQSNNSPIVIHAAPIPNKLPSLPLTHRIRLLSLPNQPVIRRLHDTKSVRDNRRNRQRRARIQCQRRSRVEGKIREAAGLFRRCCRALVCEHGESFWMVGTGRTLRRKKRETRRDGEGEEGHRAGAYVVGCLPAFGEKVRWCF